MELVHYKLWYEYLTITLLLLVASLSSELYIVALDWARAKGTTGRALGLSHLARSIGSTRAVDRAMNTKGSIYTWRESARERRKKVADGEWAPRGYPKSRREVALNGDLCLA